jgi:hypothetical protein
VFHLQPFSTDICLRNESKCKKKHKAELDSNKQRSAVTCESKIGKKKQPHIGANCSLLGSE